MKLLGLRPKSAATRYALAAVLPIVTVLVTWDVGPPREAARFLPLLALVVVSALIGGRNAGLVSASAGTVAFFLVFDFVGPGRSFGFPPIEDVLRVGVFLFIAVGLSYVCGSFRDLYDREQAARAALVAKERELAGSREQLRLVIDGVPSLLSYVGTDERYRFVNAAYQNWFGTPPAEIVGKTILEVLGKAAYDNVREHVRAALAGDRVTFETHMRYENGLERDVDIAYVPHRTADGQIAGFIVRVHDVSDRKRLEQARLHAAESERARLYRALDQAPAMIWVCEGPEHRLTYANQSCLRIVSQAGSQTVSNEPQILGRTLAEISPAPLSTTSTIAAQVFATGEPFLSNEFSGLGDPEGSYSLALNPIFDSDGKVTGTMGVAFEITDQVSARRALERAKVEAEAASRAKDEFLAMLGHELRNPLSPILTALELMKLRGDTSFEKERAVIDRQVKHVTRLVDDLLEVSRITRGKVSLDRRPVEIAQFVADAIEIASPLIEQRHHRLSVDVPRGLVVEGDRTRLAQVVANLLTNAAKYTPDGGAIAVNASRRGDELTLTVQDNGIGIREDLLPRIFDVFVQERQGIDRSQGGLGLGLAIVRSLVELHGGTVEARSDGPNKGSELTLRMPAAAEPAIATTPSPLPERGRPERGASGGLNILVVDDNEDGAELIAEAFRDLGHAVRIAHDGPTALAQLVSFVPDVAILDIGLPVMDGYELARRIRADSRLTLVRLIAVTGYGQPDDRRRSEEAGFDAHIVKPLELGTLEALIQGAKQKAAPDAAGGRGLPAANMRV